MSNKQRIAKALKGHVCKEDADVRAIIEEQLKDILEYAALDGSTISDDLLRYVVICLASAIYTERAALAGRMADSYLKVSA